MTFQDYFRRYEIHLEQEIHQLREELAQARGEITRLNLAIMPLASPAGKVYVDSVRPMPAAPPPLPIDNPNSWASIQAKRIRENEELDRQEAEAAKGNKP